MDGWLKVLLTLTEFGLVHSGQSYSDTLSGILAVTLTDPASGYAVQLADGGLSQGVVSPNGSKVAGLKDGQLVVVNLQDLSYNALETAAPPDQFIWRTDDELIYTTRELNGDIFAELNEDEHNRLVNAIGSDVTPLPRYTVGIHLVGLQGGSTLYTADAYGIGKLYYSDDTLIFSQIENHDRWVAGVLDGTLAELDTEAFKDSVDTQTYALSMTTLEPVLILEDASRMNPRPQ